jgi:hypothetical protein
VRVDGLDLAVDGQPAGPGPPRSGVVTYKLVDEYGRGGREAESPARVT